jgi:putative FmdB family regulatory protein
MPTYEYECKKCGNVFDLFQSIKASPLKKTMCEKCKVVRPVKRLIGTGGAVLFKGSGFYQTDYRSDTYKKAAQSDPKASSTDTAKTDAKPSTEAAKPAATTPTEKKSTKKKKED